jgi:hypothetical protein
MRAKAAYGYYFRNAGSLERGVLWAGLAWGSGSEAQSGLSTRSAGGGVARPPPGRPWRGRSP